MSNRDSLNLNSRQDGATAAPQSLAGALRSDQDQRWQRNDCVRVEDYLEQHAALKNDPNGILDLIYNEIYLREQRGESSRLDEYVERFPDLAEAIRAQFEVHQALQASTIDPSTAITKPPVLNRESARVIPGYEILGVLGRGGMGVVYKARHNKLNRIVALKMILSGGHAGEAELERFRIEAEAVARLQHPNIVQIFEIGEHEGLPYFSLEFCEGGSLARKLGGTPLPPIEAAKLVETLAKAMQAAHQKSIIHRDLKPANVLLTGDDAPKITDFGLAKKLDDAGQTASGAVMGTPSYMAPEQAAGKSKEIGPLADVYALGAILYECLTGRPPFKAATSVDTILQVISEDPVPPSRLNARVPRDLETVCLKCLQKESPRRYGSAGDLAADLRRFLQGEPIVARRSGIAERAWKWAKRRPAVAALLSILCAVLVGSSLALTVLWLDAEEQRSAALKASADAEDRAKKEETARRQADDEKDRAERLLYFTKVRLAYLDWQNNHIKVALDHLAECRQDFRNWEYDYVHRLCHGSIWTFAKPMNVHPDVGAWLTSALAFSPDGKTIACSVYDPWIHILDARTGRELRSMTGHSSIVTALSFSADGKRLASAAYGDAADAATIVWDSKTGQKLFSLPTGQVTALSLTPDGKAVACGVLDGRIRVWTVQDGKEATVFYGHKGCIASLKYCLNSKLISSSADGSVRLWDAITGKPMLILENPNANIYGVAISADGKQIAGGEAGVDHKVSIWDAVTGEKTNCFPGHRAIVFGLSFSPDGKRLATAGDDKTVRVWDIEKGKELLSLKGHTHGIGSVSFSPDGSKIASAGAVMAKLWDASTDPEVSRLPNDGAVASLTAAADGQRMIGAAADKSIKVWDITTGQLKHWFRDQPGYAIALRLPVTGQPVAAGWDDNKKTIDVWDIVTRKVVYSLSSCNKVTRAGLGLTPDAKRLVVVCSDGRADVWDMDSGNKRSSFPGRKREGSTGAMAIRPDGIRVASSNGTSVLEWDLETGQFVQSFDGHTPAIILVAYSSDGKRLLSAGQDGVAKVWDATTGRLLFDLKGHGNQVQCGCFSPNGSRIITGSADGTLRVWDASTGYEALTLRGSSRGIGSVVFSLDGRYLFSSADDGVKRWASK